MIREKSNFLQALDNLYCNKIFPNIKCRAKTIQLLFWNQVSTAIKLLVLPAM